MKEGAANISALGRRDRAVLILLLVLIIVFGVITVNRSAFLKHRHTDADVYFRAAWTIQSGTDLYRVTDTNGWHYHSPPLLAILLLPFSDPPDGAPARWAMNYPLAVTLWYIISVMILWWGLHMLAGAIERTSPRSGIPARYERRWWALRVIPVLVCLPMVGYTLGRGQVNFLLLLSLCGMSASLLRGKEFRSGLWLSFGACIKPYILVVLLYPLVRRKWKCVGGLAVGMLIGMVLIPVLVMGPARAARVYEDFYELRLKGMISGKLAPSIADELHVFQGEFPTYGVSLYKALHTNPKDWPEHLPAGYSLFQTAFAGVLVILSLFAAGMRKKDFGKERLLEVLGPGAVILAVLPAISTCKPHYFALAALPVMGLIASVWERRGEASLSPGWSLLLVVYCASNFFSEISRVAFLDSGGAAPLVSLVLWSACMMTMLHYWKRKEQGSGREAAP